AGQLEELRTTRTLAGLAAAEQARLIGADDAAALAASWRLATRIRNAVVLLRGRASDVLPAKQAELAAVARILGYSPDASQDLVEDYRRTARRARRRHPRPLRRSTCSALTVTAPRHSSSAAGDQTCQLNIQPPSSRCAAARRSRCAPMTAGSNRPRLSDPGSGAKSSGLCTSPGASGSRVTRPWSRMREPA